MCPKVEKLSIQLRKSGGGKNPQISNAIPCIGHPSPPL